MHRLRPSLPLFAAGLLALAGCSSTAPRATAPAVPAAVVTTAPASPALVDARARIAALQVEVAPDRRTDRFDVVATDSAGRLVLTGTTTDRAALGRLTSALAPSTVSRVRVLPDEGLLGAERYALVTVSVANLRSEPAHSAELATQALLGTPLRLLDRRGGWYLAQTPDRYLAWVDAGGIARMDRAALDAHARAERVVVVDPDAKVEDSQGRVLSDLVVGAVLDVDSEAPQPHVHIPVVLPDGRRGRVAQAAVRDYDRWIEGLRVQPEALVQTAHAFAGVPYLWGGTSNKGMDCSGFTKTVYLMHGLVLPRDASQQVRAGTLVDETGEWDRLRPGDLVFFGVKAQDGRPERVVHVGMWLGGREFIHASGYVRVSSMDPAAANYEPSERARYLRARRYDEAAPGVALLRQGGLYAVAQD